MFCCTQWYTVVCSVFCCVLVVSSRYVLLSCGGMQCCFVIMGGCAVWCHVLLVWCIVELIVLCGVTVWSIVV